MSSGLIKDWITKAGFRAAVVMTRFGHHCGYVGVPKGHPLHGAQYHDPHPALQAPPEGEPVGKRSPIAILCAALDESRMQSPEMVFNVHGGITYSSGENDYPVPSDGLWWFGYDCNHLGDSPSYEVVQARRDQYPYQPFMWGNTDGAFRDLDYCINECESLAQQIVDLVRAPTA